MLPKQNRLSYSVATVFIGLTVLTTSLCFSKEAPVADNPELTRAAEYRQKVMTWYTENNVPRKAFYQKLYEPVLKGVKKDYDHNKKMANKYKERATRAYENDYVEKAKELKQVALLYWELAQTNVKIGKAIKELDGKKINNGIEKVVTLERQIKELTERAPKRSWYTPEEVRAEVKRLHELEQEKKKEQNGS